MTDVTQLETRVQTVLDQIVRNNMAHGSREFLYARMINMIDNHLTLKLSIDKVIA